MTERPVLRYLRACFAWEYAHVGDVRLRGSRTRLVQPLAVETLASGLSIAAVMDGAGRDALRATIERHVRGSTVLLALFVVVTPPDGVERRASVSPLFLADIDDPVGWLAVAPSDRVDPVDGSGASTPFASAGPRRPLVNRPLLERLLADDGAADALADSLQALLGAGPLDKRAAAAIADTLTRAVPGLRSDGFDRYPLLDVDIAAEPAPSAPQLRCAAAVLVLRRSRRSRGILHELARLDTDPALSAPLRALLGDGPERAVSANRVGRRRPLDAPGTLSPAQRRAVAAAGTRTLSVVHGPPGTGKTHTLAMLVSDTVANGGSVLVCSRNAAAVDVVQRFLRERLALGGAIVRGGDPGTRRELKRRLASLLNGGALRLDDPGPAVAALDVADAPAASWRGVLRRVTAELRRADRELVRLERRIERERSLARGDGSGWARLRHAAAALFTPSSTLALADAVAARRALIERRGVIVVARTRLLLRGRVTRLLARERASLARLVDSVTAREQRQRELQAGLDYEALLVPFPIWLTTLDEVGQLVPLARELFDLVIVDEASQVDCASALPALQRARRAVVLGDAAQLRHISFLPGEIENELRRAHAAGVVDAPGFRADSLLDWANRRIADPAAVSLLDEHFRSHPDIIGFSARELYDDRLHLLTALTRAGDDQSVPSPLELVRVADGARARGGANRREAEALLGRLVAMTSQGVDPPRTIGIVSPFRAQVDHLNKALTRQLDAASIRRHAIVVGTAHELQGEERDVILFSACVDDRASAGELAFLSRPDVLNVAITRARHVQVVFLSRDPARCDESTLFGRYVRWVGDRDRAVHGTDRVVYPDAAVTRETGSGRIVRHPDRVVVLRALAPQGVHLLHDVRIGSLRVDLLFRRGAASFGVEWVGAMEPGVAENADRAGHDLLHRLGIPVLPLTDVDWREARAAVLERVRAALAELTAPDGSGEAACGRERAREGDGV